LRVLFYIYSKNESFFVLYIIDILANLKKYKNLVNKKATYVSGFFIKGIWGGVN